MSQVTKPGLVAVAFLVESRIRIGGRLMRPVGACFAFEVDRGIAPSVARRWPAAILFGEAFDRCQSLDHGAVDG